MIFQIVIVEQVQYNQKLSYIDRRDLNFSLDVAPDKLLIKEKSIEALTKKLGVKLKVISSGFQKKDVYRFVIRAISDEGHPLTNKPPGWVYKAPK